MFYDSGIDLVSRSISMRVERNKRRFDFTDRRHAEKRCKIAMEECGVL